MDHGIGDFGQMAGVIGGTWTAAVQTLLLAGGISLTVAVIQVDGGRDGVPL